MRVQRLVVGRDGGQKGVELGRRLVRERVPDNALEKGVGLDALNAALALAAQALIGVEHQQPLDKVLGGEKEEGWLEKRAKYGKQRGAKRNTASRTVSLRSDTRTFAFSGNPGGISYSSFWIFLNV